MGRGKAIGGGNVRAFSGAEIRQFGAIPTTFLVALGHLFKVQVEGRSRKLWSEMSSRRHEFIPIATAIGIAQP